LRNGHRLADGDLCVSAIAIVGHQAKGAACGVCPSGTGSAG
jgi:hypothetical protein